jgi:mannose-6-phosphate isomerase-like protein (cupin superfamily)
MEVKFTKNHYPIAKRVTWDDVIKKIDNDQDDEMWLVGSKPTFVCRSSFTPRSIKKVKEKVKLPELHVYISFLRDSDNFGHHKDYKDVLLVQAIGRMFYDVEGEQYCLSPGDSLYIPSEVYHAPTVPGARVTLSFSNE